MKEPDTLEESMTLPEYELAAVRRAWAPVVEEIERTAHVVGRVLGEHMEASAQRRRVRTMKQRQETHMATSVGTVAGGTHPPATPRQEVGLAFSDPDWRHRDWRTQSYLGEA